MSILFHDLIFGPVSSRRLGYSLGINLLPINTKTCTLNCVYCECGWNPEGNFDSVLGKHETIIRELENRLVEIKEKNEPLDVLTFAGNGEPTMHPKFLEIVTDVATLRDRYFPGKKIAVLSNSTMLWNPRVKMALKKVDMPILKLDSAVEDTFWVLNNPPSGFNFEKHIQNIKKFNHSHIIQTMFLRGVVNNIKVDNTSKREIEELIKLLLELKPEKVMIYSLDREPPEKDLHKIGHEELKLIADKMEENNLKVQIA